jgi:hypothetical protein
MTPEEKKQERARREARERETKIVARRGVIGIVLLLVASQILLGAVFVIAARGPGIVIGLAVAFAGLVLLWPALPFTD